MRLMRTPRAKERLDQAGPLETRQHGRLESGPASFVMRRRPALHDARPDAMAKKLAGREQSGRPGTHDQDGRWIEVGHELHLPAVSCGVFILRSADLQVRIMIMSGLEVRAPAGAPRRTQSLGCGTMRR